MVRERAVHLETQRRRAAGKVLEQVWGNHSRNAVSGIEDDVEGFDDGGVNEAEYVPDVILQHVHAGQAPRVSGLCRQAGEDHVADVADARVAAQRKRLAAHHLDAVVLLGVVRRGNLRPSVVPVPGDGVVQHVRAHHPVIDNVGSLRACALDEGCCQ